MAMRPGFHTVTPYLIFDDALAAYHYYQKAFSAQPAGEKHVDDKGLLRHGELRIGDSMIMMCTSVPEFPDMKSALKYGGSPLHLFIYHEDADAFFNQAVEHGCKVVMPMDDKEYGRTGGVADQFGFTWWVATHKG
jgi:PhnB protein